MSEKKFIIPKFAKFLANPDGPPGDSGYTERIGVHGLTKKTENLVNEKRALGFIPGAIVEVTFGPDSVEIFEIESVNDSGYLVLTSLETGRKISDLTVHSPIIKLKRGSETHPEIGDGEDYSGMNKRIKDGDILRIKQLAVEHGIEKGVELRIKNHGRLVRVRVIDTNFHKSSRCLLKKLDEDGKEVGGEFPIGLLALVASANEAKLERIKALAERQKKN